MNRHLHRLAVAAAAASATIEPAAADIVDLLAASDAVIEDLGNAGGLASYQVTPAGEEESYTLYVTPEGYAVAGLLYDDRGILVTADQIAGLAAIRPDEPAQPATAPPSPPGEASGGFVIGATGPPVRVYADPACSWSRGTVARLATAAIEGRLILEVLPVALLGAESARLALAAAGAGGAEAWFARRTADPDPPSAARVCGVSV